MNSDSIGRMTREQKERLFDWHHQEAVAWFDEQAELDPTFGAMMEATEQAEALGLEEFEIVLAGEVAENAASGVTGQEWLTTALSASNAEMQKAFKDAGIVVNPQQAAQLLARSIETLKIVGLWPW